MLIKKIDVALKWITDQYTTVIKNAITDAFALLGAAPCNYVILGLGPFSRNQCSPSTKVQYAILTAVCISKPCSYHNN